MTCAICGGEASEPLDITENVHEMLCAGDMRAWRESPGFALAEQLVDLGKLAEAIQQYRDFTARREREIRRAA